MSPQPISPHPGQESVWDYPRPPRLEPTTELVEVLFNGELIAQSRRCYRVLETSHPPTYYIPPHRRSTAVSPPQLSHLFL